MRAEVEQAAIAVAERVTRETDSAGRRGGRGGAPVGGDRRRREARGVARHRPRDRGARRARSARFGQGDDGGRVARASSTMPAPNWRRAFASRPKPPPGRSPRRRRAPSPNSSCGSRSRRSRTTRRCCARTWSNRRRRWPNVSRASWWSRRMRPPPTSARCRRRRGRQAAGHAHERAFDGRGSRAPDARCREGGHGGSVARSARVGARGTAGERACRRRSRLQAGGRSRGARRGRRGHARRARGRSRGRSCLPPARGGECHCGRGARRPRAREDGVQRHRVAADRRRRRGGHRRARHRGGAAGSAEPARRRCPRPRPRLPAWRRARCHGLPD